MDRKSTTFGDQLSNLNHVLRSFKGKVSVLKEGKGVTAVELDKWKQTHRFTRLPSDLVEFLKACDGFSLHWNLLIGQSSCEVGCMNINQLRKIVPVSLQPEDSCSGLTNRSHPFRVFAIDSSSPYTLVAVVCFLPTYSNHVNINSGNLMVLPEEATNEPKSEIWYRDSCRSWHFVANSFTAYLRLMIEHLGIHGWQNMFSTSGVDIDTETWFRLLIPQRCKVSLEGYRRNAQSVDVSKTKQKTEESRHEGVDLSYLDTIKEKKQTKPSQRQKYNSGGKFGSGQRESVSRLAHGNKTTSKKSLSSRPLSAPLRKPRPMLPVRQSSSSHNRKAYQ